ncbi:MAG: AAA family ATPase [Pseudonocardiales bacterium]|nr:MAG: AAA family ATPase [Pseudonocardiales bacterium]
MPAELPGAARIHGQDIQRARAVLDQVSAVYADTIVGQRELRISLLVTLMARGHILLESVPGLAKTTAAATLARAVNASFARIQCTPDLLPSDIIGTQVFDGSTSTFRTQLGPVHAHFVLLDEINRSSAKTQSAMLEAMQERQTSIGGTIYPLPSPFMVLATQNPIEEEGTYVLPQAQMDRFLLKEVIGYPEPEAEVEVLRRVDHGASHAQSGPPGVSLDDVSFLQDLLGRVFIADAARHYIVAIVNATRRPAGVLDAETAGYVEYGVSPRGTIALQQVARAVALINGRGFVIPEDVKLLRHSVLRHRLVLNFDAVANKVTPESIIDAVFRAVPTP